MTSIFKRIPVVKERSLYFRVAIIILSLISGAFMISPTIVYFIKKSSPLTEMPTNSFFYILKALFAISIIIASVIFAVYKNTKVIAIPSFIGLLTTIYPFVYKINVYKEYKSFIEQFSMTADYTSYLVNIGIYALFMLLCLLTLLYSLGLLPNNLIVLVFSALTITAVIFVTVDRAKIIEYDIYNIYDILSFTYASVTALLPAVFTLSTKIVKSNKKTSRYKPKRMRS
ncbi:MAG: hypothetical protein E7566_00765 [Ruminococcaceae bacterium]|nr:hypothetical protein [Oscillospiraceae bacterium]